MGEAAGGRSAGPGSFLSGYFRSQSKDRSDRLMQEFKDSGRVPKQGGTEVGRMNGLLELGRSDGEVAVGRWDAECPFWKGQMREARHWRCEQEMGHEKVKRCSSVGKKRRA